MNDSEPSVQSLPQPEPHRKAVNWRQDLEILARMRKVQPLHFAGYNNYQIANMLGVDEATVRNDLKRLQALWKEQIADDAALLRARVVVELGDIQRRAIAAAEFDEEAERAVLYGKDAKGKAVHVDHPEKGSISFRGNKSGSLNVARQAIMDRAKVLGLIVDKAEVGGEGLVRIYERGSRDAGGNTTEG